MRLRLCFAVAISMLTLGAPQRVAANTIYVTTLEDKISSTGGCSLKEAIYASKFHLSIAVTGYSEFHGAGSPIYTATQCVAGSGDDVIILPPGQVLLLTFPVSEAENFMGPTATPMIISTVTIEGYGATLQYAQNPAPNCGGEAGFTPRCDHFRAFAVGDTGHLTIRNTYIKGFFARGGDGADAEFNGGGGRGGGGGGMGAGGAVYVHRGSVVVENSTFDGNGAVGGNGGRIGHDGGGGGGGGLSGRGGVGACGESIGFGSGGGGGGSRGDGDDGSCQPGGGGGTVSDGGCCGFFDSNGEFDFGGFDCGGAGATDQNLNGQDAQCAGGGGGGAAASLTSSGNGGHGSYGGGGGGGANGGGNGGSSEFGGGGGAGWTGFFGGTTGGTGGFGGGGGAAENGQLGGGHPGAGGMFGGRADAGDGGGGAGLGGAIFNDSGGVLVENSTFTNNYVTRGVSGGGSADNGADAGGAIFTVDGHLRVHNTTIANNQSTGSGGGIVVAQTTPDKDVLFELDNTIIWNNGSMDAQGNLTEANSECSLMASVAAVAAAGNLIQNNDNCQGLVSSDDPQLGPLQDNGGFTPTMAIAENTPPWNAADPGSSLGFDQRGQRRPADDGFDIGAFELCVNRSVKFDVCAGLVGVPNPVALTILVQPPTFGTTSPAPGNHNPDLGSIVPLLAIPNPGYAFSSWSGNVGNQQGASTSIVMLEPQTVTANFALCNCVVDVTPYVTITRGGFVLNLSTGRYAQNVTLTNNSAFTIIGPISLVLDRLSSNAALFNLSGFTDIQFPPAGSPYITANVNLAPGQNVVLALQFTDPTKAAITYSTRVLAGPGPR